MENRKVLIEFELDGERYADDSAVTVRTVRLMYEGHNPGPFCPPGVVNVRWVALDGVYRPCADPVELHA